MSDLLALIRSCPGLHPAAPQEGHARVNWQISRPRTDRVRVRRHTCDCRPIVYELCQGGGLMFVRRLDRSGKTQQVHETEWVHAAKAEQLWMRIVLGHAR